MLDVIIGNILSCCAQITDSISGTRKGTKKVLGVQLISVGFYIATNIVLKGYSAVVQNVVAVFRNLLAISKKELPVIEWILTALGVVLGVVFNNRGLAGLLPVVANLQYTVVVFKFKNNEKYLKISFIITLLMFLIFNVVIKNYVGAVLNVVASVTTGISVYKYIKSEKAVDKMPESEVG